MREAGNIRAVAALGVDLVGFIFCETSARNVAMLPSGSGIVPDRASRAFTNSTLSAVEGKEPKRVGVFVDGMAQDIIRRVYSYRLDYIQLHGWESPVAIDNLRRTIDPDICAGIKIIKTISVREAEDIRRWRDYKGHVDMLLFDTKCATHGGSGDKFDWRLLEGYDGDIPFLLSGGIGPGDAGAVCDFDHEMFAGIDINSRFETSPGMKDIGLVESFVRYIRRHRV